MLEVVVAREPMRHRGLIAAGQPRQHPRGCVGTRRASRVLQRPAAASTAPGHSGYMDTPVARYAIISLKTKELIMQAHERLSC